MQSETLRKQIKAMWAVLAMLTIWCLINTVKINTFMPDFSSINKTVNILLERVNTIEEKAKKVFEENSLESFEEIYKEQTEFLESFPERFCRMRNKYGSGHIFDWQGELFTTYYAEELVTFNE